LRHHDTALQGVLQQSGTQFHALRSGIDGQTAKDHHWNRIGHLLSNGTGSFLVRYATSGQSVVTHDLSFWGGHNERSTCTADLVTQGTSFEPLVKHGFAARE
jgi:hypothetical protein